MDEESAAAGSGPGLSQTIDQKLTYIPVTNWLAGQSMDTNGNYARVGQSGFWGGLAPV
jgi:hypothetical protein